MKQPSLQDKVVKHLSLEYPAWVSKGSLIRLEWRSEKGTTYLPDYVGRELRKAEESRKIAVKYDGKNTLYKWLPHELREKYIPTSQRTGDQLFV